MPPIPARLAFAAALVMLGACSDAPPAPAPLDPSADAAFALLQRVPPGLAAEAFRRLETGPYTVEVRFEEVDAAGRVTSRSNRTLHREPGADGGVLEEALGGEGAGLGPLRLTDPVALLLPDDPPHLDARTRERYRFRTLPDTIVDGRRLRAAEAVLLPGEDEPIRRARAWADATTGAPAGVGVERASDGPFFSEAGRAVVWLAPDPDGRPLPRRAVADARVDVPMEEPHRFRLDLEVMGDG